MKKHRSEHRYIRLLLSATLVVMLLSSCATLHVWASDDGDSAHGTCLDCRTTEWSYAWGLVQPTPVKPDCRNKSMSRVRVKTTFAHALVTVATLGIAMPQTVEWDCAPQDVPTEDLGN